MNLKEIKEMITLMNENDLSELEIEKDGTKIKIKKAPAELPDYRIQPPSYRIETIAPPGKPVENTASPAATSPAKTTKEISSPMVGTFYASASPESPSFVNVGDSVDVSSVACIIEAMKVMNEIHAEVKGTIVERLVKNGQGVEFGQPLFKVKPS